MQQDENIVNGDETSELLNTPEALNTENNISIKPTDENTVSEIVGVRFKKNGKTYYFAPNDFNLEKNTAVIVDTSRGIEYGTVAVTNRKINTSQLSEPLRSVLRIATEDDKKQYEENKKREIDAYNSCIALIDKHRLDMKLIDTEFEFDRSKMIFYFSSEDRVDFRELVKDLASTFHTRIEMRQIGIRDEAKLLGGLGICGRPYCCSSFLTDFGQVSVKMAKEQNLSLNTAKISGSCGRLMCCLRYEYDTYLAEKALTPKVDSRVVTPSGIGTVIAANPLAGIVKVRLEALGDDSEPVIFVREDCIEESEYDGRELKKTELPKRNKNDDTIPDFSKYGTSSEAGKITASNEPAVSEKTKADAEASEKGKPNKHKKHKKNQNRPVVQGKPAFAPVQNEQKEAPRQVGTEAPADKSDANKKKKRFFRHYGKNGGQKKGNNQQNK